MVFPSIKTNTELSVSFGIYVILTAIFGILMFTAGIGFAVLTGVTFATALADGITLYSRHRKANRIQEKV